MTHRERVRLILNHEEADRPAMDLGSTRMTGTSAWTYAALRRALGLPDKPVRVCDLMQMLATVDDDVLDALGADFVEFRAASPGPACAPEWKSFTFREGQTFNVPEAWNAVVRDDGAIEFPADAPTMRMPADGWYFDRIPVPGAEVQITHQHPSEWRFAEPFGDAYLDSEGERAKRLFESMDRALVLSIGALAGALQGYGEVLPWAMKLLTDPEHCREYMMRKAEAAADCYGQYLDAVGEFVEVVNISAWDYGMQDREQFRPGLFAEFYLPAWRKVTEVIHRFGVKTWIHCCGSVPNLIPHFIEAGVDCLNPVQWTAAGMDLETLKKTYGDKLVFWGGAANTQRTLPFSGPDEVAREVRGVLNIMSPGGGYVLNAIHNIQADVPVENTLAMYREGCAYRPCVPGRATRDANAKAQET